MAERMGTLSGEAGDTRTQTLVSLDDSGEVNDPGVGSAEDTTTILTQLRQENETLRQQNERHRQQITGWEGQSRRNLDELNATKERLARIEGQVSAVVQGRAAGTPEADLDTADPTVLAELNEGLNLWARDDAAGLTKVVRAVRKLTPQQQAQQGLQPGDVERLVQQQLAQYGQKATMQSLIAVRHPEMASAEHPLYSAAWDAYDAYAAKDDTSVLYGKDDTRMVPFPSAKGTKLVDVRILDRLLADLKLEGGYAEGRRAEVRDAARGSAMTGNGRQSTSRRTVEAVELLTPDEKDALQDPRVRRGWGKDLPTDPKAAAKYLYDGLTPAEKARRLAEYRATGQVNPAPRKQGMWGG